MNASEFLFGSWDTKLLTSSKLEKEERILGSYHEPVVLGPLSHWSKDAPR